MSASVVFASPPPVPVPVPAEDAACVTGADGARGGGERAKEAGSAPGMGGTDGTRSGMGGVGATGLVELGLFVHASSSKPDAMAAEFDLEGTCWTGEVVVATAGAAAGEVVVVSGVVERAICSETEEMAPRSTAPGVVLPDLLGVGRPLRAFLS